MRLPPPTLHVAEDLDGFSVTLPTAGLRRAEALLGALLYAASVVVCGGLFATLTLAISALAVVGASSHGRALALLGMVGGLAAAGGGLIVGVQLGASVAEVWQGILTSGLGRAQPVLSVQGRLLTVRTWRGVQTVPLCDVASVGVERGALCAVLVGGERRRLVRPAEAEHTRWLQWALGTLLPGERSGSTADIPRAVRRLREHIALHQQR